MSGPVAKPYLARHGLTPAMRQAVAITGITQGMRGLYHGATIAALVNHGLAYRVEGYGYEDHDWLLTVDGVRVRQDLRARVNRMLELAGWEKLDEEGLYWHAPAGHSHEEVERCSRGTAMKEVNIKW